MYTLVDNATLTAVQRLSGEIPIKNKYIIDSDIMAFEAFAQAVLFSEKVFYIDDYKSRYRQDRRSFFSQLESAELDQETYGLLEDKTKKLYLEMVPRVEGGYFSDENFKPFFEQLKMHNIFTWDMHSSVFYLTQKLLAGRDADIQKYSHIQAMIFAELRDDSFIKNCPPNQPELLDSRGNPIDGNYLESENYAIPSTVEAFFANLNWLSYRTIFYTLAAREFHVTLMLHPIRASYQINMLKRYNPQYEDAMLNLIHVLNGEVTQTVESIFSPTEPYVFTYDMPLFTAWLALHCPADMKLSDFVYHIREEGSFIRARQLLLELEQLAHMEKGKAYHKKCNKLILTIKLEMNRIREKFHVNTPQGIALSPFTCMYNMSRLALPEMPAIPTLPGNVKGLSFLKDIGPKNGFAAIYKSLIQDLTQVSRLGNIYEKIVQRVKVDEHAAWYTLKDEKDPGKEFHWKKPM